jgi:N-acetylneuraminic acid mutarotase
MKTLLNYRSVWLVFVVLLASLGVGSKGGGCMGTQMQVKMIGGASGTFQLITPTNGAMAGLIPRFSWTSYPFDLTNFILQISTTSSFTGVIFYQNTNISRYATGFQMPTGILATNTYYYWRVIAVDRDTGTSTLATCPGVEVGYWVFSTGITPGAFTLSSPNDGDVINTLTPILIWNLSANATEYKIQIDDEPGFNEPRVAGYGTPIDRSVGNAVVHQVAENALQPGIVYYWRVIAYSKDYLSVSSASRRFTTPSPPSAFLLSTPLNGSTQYTLNPTFTWTGSTGADYYHFGIIPSDFSTITRTFTNITTTSFTIPSGILSSNTSYYWDVYAHNAYGDANNKSTLADNAKTAYFITVDVRPQEFNMSYPPDKFTITVLAPTFEWSTSSLATSYELIITSTSSTRSFPGITTISYTIPAGTIEHGIRYWWRVIASNSYATKTAYNAPFYFDTNVKPGNFTLTEPVSGSEVTSLTPAFTWTASSLASNYTLQISTTFNPFTPIVTYTGIAATTFTIPSALVDNNSYYWMVIALNAQPVTNTATNAPFAFRTNVKPWPFLMLAPVTGTVLDTLTPSFSWEQSWLANSYDLVITRTSDENAIRISGITTTSYNLLGGLVHGQNYIWSVTARSVQTTRTTIATNAPRSFSVDVAPRTFFMQDPVSGTLLSIVDPTLTWGVSTLADSYTVYISLTSTLASPIHTQSIAGTSYTVPSGVLITGTYWWGVRASNPSTSTWASNSPYNFSVDVYPRGFALTSPISGATISTLTPNLQWGTSTLATTYYVQIDNESSFFSPLVYENTDVTTTSFNVPSGALDNLVQYWWRVIAVNNYGSRLANNQPYSFTPRVRPLNFSLVSPTNLSIINTLTPTFTWTSALYTTTYTLQVDTESGFAVPLVYENNNISSSVTSFLLPSSLETNRTYYWRVIATNTEGQTVADNVPYSFQTRVYPTAFTLVEPANGATIYTLTPVLKWTSSTVHTNYAVQIDNEPTFGSPIIYEDLNITTTATSITVPGATLTGNVTYYWRVIARNSTGDTIATNAPYQFRAGTSPDAFDLVSPITASVETTLTPAFTWTSSLNATGYTVQIHTEPTFTPPILLNDSSITPGTLSYVVSNGVLSQRTTYYWRVIAANAFGQTIATNAPLSFETFPSGTPPDSFNLISPNNTVVTSYTPTLTWQDTRGEIGYTIQVVTDTGYWATGPYVYTTTAIARNTASFELPIDAIPISGTYYWRVIAQGVGGAGNTNAIAPFTMIIDATTSPWKPPSSEIADILAGRRGHTAIWTASDMIIWGGYISGTQITYYGDGMRYNLSSNSWDYIATLNAPSPRTGHTAIWTSSYMIIWGGYNETGYLNSGALYNPTNNTWVSVTLTGAPESRANHTAIWDGTRMIVWGGTGIAERLNTGGRYTPLGSWSTTDTLSPYCPSAREGHSAVWDNANFTMLIWGGFTGSAYLNSGARYNPSDNTWTRIFANIPASRTGHTNIWSGTQMLLFGGTNPSANVFYPVVTGATISSGDGRYNPPLPLDSPNDYWASFPVVDLPSARAYHTAVWTDNQMLIWGGRYGSSTYLNTGSRYSSGTNSWAVLPTTNAPISREGHTAVWTGQEMLVWGGYNGLNYLNTGARYNLSLDTWTTLPPPATALPVSRVYATMVFTSITPTVINPAVRPQVIIWGGWSGSLAFKNGVRYDPVNNNWRSLTEFSAPSLRYRHTAVWTDPITTTQQRRMLIWGGYDGSQYVNTGSAYYPSDVDGGSWATLTSPPLSGRAWHSAVWAYDESSDTNEILVFGGRDSSFYYNTGARYQIVSDTWVAMSTSNAPAARFNHTACWANSISPISPTMMIVWGGIDSSGTPLATGGKYIPVSDTWLSMSAPPAGFSARDGHTAVWTGQGSESWRNKMLIFGGYSGAGGYLNTGALYDPVLDTWTTITSTNAPSIRGYHNATWLEWIGGQQRPGMVIWGGRDASSYFNTGAQYDPVSNTWTTLSTTGTPTGRAYHSSVLIDFIHPIYNRRVTEMFIWGGEIGAGSYTSSGSRYKPR